MPATHICRKIPGYVEQHDTCLLYTSIPLGTLSGIQFFSGLGPKITVQVQPLSLVTSQVRSNFSQAGVNQTRLEITICFSVQIGALLAGEVIPVDIQSEILAAQVLIVGEVPQLYAQNGWAGEKA